MQARRLHHNSIGALSSPSPSANLVGGSAARVAASKVERASWSVARTKRPRFGECVVRSNECAGILAYASGLCPAGGGLCVRLSCWWLFDCRRLAKLMFVGLADAAVHSEQPRRRRGKAVVAEGFGAGGADHRAQRRGRLSGGLAPRWHALRLLAVAVPHSHRARW